MEMPTDIAVTKQGRAYVVDSGHDRILAYDREGEHLFEFGAGGDGEGQLRAPVGIGIGTDGRVLVADRGNHRVQVFDEQGGFIRTLRIPNPEGHTAPVDVAADGAGRIYVTLTDHRIMLFDAGGEPAGVWGKPGSNAGEFRYPATLALGPERELYVVDVLNTRVQAFDLKGKPLVSLGKWGVLPGQFFRPKGVAVAPNGFVFVSDSYLGVVQLFGSDARFKAVLGNGGGVYRFDTPAGIAVSDQGLIYVAEMLANKVTAIQLVPKR
jgi:DNA-binding beta-propeller fold protein YncE